jgi:hypothetical protein
VESLFANRECLCRFAGLAWLGQRAFRVCHFRGGVFYSESGVLREIGSGKFTIRS